MIANKELKVTCFSQRLLALKHRHKRSRRTMFTGLMLTSMVDMFSLLVIFLLQSFSNSPDVMAITKGIVLPAAVSASAPVDAPVLTITDDQVILDQKPVAAPKAILDDPTKLMRPLQELKTGWQHTHPKDEFKGDIHLQADRHLSSVLVSRVINIVNSQGYSSVQLAVVSGANK